MERAYELDQAVIEEIGFIADLSINSAIIVDELAIPAKSIANVLGVHETEVIFSF